MKLEDEFVYPINIGTWLSYSPHHDEEQLEEQELNFISLPIENELGEYKFIYTKTMAKLCDYIDNTINHIKIEDTTTVLEDEIYYTAKIEGANTTRKRTSELHNGMPIKQDNEYSERMVKNGFDAVKLMNLYGNKIDKEILYKIWTTLTEGCCDNLDIRGERYRNGGIDINGHSGVNPTNIDKYMDKWIDFYNSDKFNSRPFIKASILHYSFENIHPFCDGNGRMGRLLVNNYLLSQGIESAKAVSFSMAINNRRIAYDASFVAAENIKNDCTPFIEFFLDIMAEAYESALSVQKIKKENILSSQMEQIRENFATDYRNGNIHPIEWQGKLYKLPEFEDLYIAQCKIEGVTPNVEISDHFWKNCVVANGYEPVYCNKDDKRINI